MLCKPKLNSSKIREKFQISNNCLVILSCFWTALIIHHPPPFFFSFFNGIVHVLSHLLEEQLMGIFGGVPLSSGSWALLGLCPG